VAWLLLRMVLDVVAFVVGRGAGVGSSRAGGSQIYLSARGCALVLSSLCFFDGQPLAAFKHFLVDDKFASTAGHNSSEIMAAPTAVGVSGDGDTEIGAATLGVRAVPILYGRRPKHTKLLVIRLTFWLTKCDLGDTRARKSLFYQYELLCVPC
jgi:hypothetical protein